MWVDLQIKHLCAMKIDYEVEEELGKLPDDLAATYDQIYKRIQNDARTSSWALKALMWILEAEELLSPDEWVGGVSWASSLRPDGNPPKLEMAVLLDVCQNLVVHDAQQNVMRFAHLSVQEFLEAKALDCQAAEMVASACLAVLQHPHTLNTRPTASTDFTAFHRYSIRYWPEHVRQCDDNEPTPQLSSTLSAFMGSSVRAADAYIHWLEAATTMSHGYNGFKNSTLRNRIQRLWSTPPNPLFAAALFGFKVCGYLWEPNTFDPNCTNDAQETLLYLASLDGNTATIRLLLQNGADINHPAHRDDTAPLLAAIERHDPKVLDLLLDAGAIFIGTGYPSMVLAGASAGNGAVMQLLLQRDASIEITEAIITAAAGNWNSGKEVMELLLPGDSGIEITGAVVTAVAENMTSGKEVIELLLQRDASIDITEAVVIAAAGNWYGGKEMMEVLLQRDSSIEITEAVLITAAENTDSGKETIELLLQRDPSIEITEAVVSAAAGNWDSGKEMMQLLLHRDARIRVTEAVVAAAAGNWDSGKEVMELLLQRDARMEVTENVLTAAAENERSGKEVMEMLLQRDPSIEITETVVTAAASNWKSGNEIMQQLLQRDPSIEITETVVTAAASNWESGSEITLLLLQRDPSIEITEFVVTAAARNRRSGKAVMELLLKRDSSIEITDVVVTTAAGNEDSGKEVMELLLQRDGSIEITEAVVTAAVGNRDSGKKVMELLLQTERAFVTKSSLTAAAFFGQQEWFERLRSKIDADSIFAQNDMQCLIAAIEGGNSLILDACLVSSHEPDGTDDHGWTLHMVAMQSRNQAAIDKFQNTSEEPMQPMSVTRWEVNPIISPFVSIGGDGTSLAYSGNFPGFPAKFQGLTIAGSSLGSRLSVKGNHPFPPGNMGKNYFEVEVLDFSGRCVINLVRCALTNSS
jgi:predicted transcriptional regulator